jgi:hypothetical protein
MTVSAAVLLLAVAPTSGCTPGEERDAPDASSASRAGPADLDAGGAPPSDSFGQSDAASPPDEPAVVSEVYGNSATVLYRLDPKTKQISEVGPFKGCDSVIDIAIDENSNLIADGYSALYSVDKTTAQCTKISGASGLPDSLSFVPKGTLDASVEALVGYTGANYVRIDPKTGGTTVVGSLDAGGLISSGDIVSVKGGPTFLTAKVNVICTNAECAKCNGTDCLLEVDPKTGKMLKNWGALGHKDVFGLSYWGGRLYGFDNAGYLFEIKLDGVQLTVTDIAMPSKPKDLSFWGAASSTSAPLVFVGPA